MKPVKSPNYRQKILFILSLMWTETTQNKAQIMLYQLKREESRTKTSKWEETYQTTRSWIKANANQKSNLRPVQGSQNFQPVVLRYSLYNIWVPILVLRPWFRLQIWLPLPLTTEMNRTGTLTPPSYINFTDWLAQRIWSGRLDASDWLIG
jgi:hypothetical protein